MNVSVAIQPNDDNGSKLKKRGDVKWASAYTGLSCSWLNKARMKGDSGPRFLKIGTRVLYRQEDLDAFLEKNLYASTSEYDDATFSK